MMPWTISTEGLQFDDVLVLRSLLRFASGYTTDAWVPHSGPSEGDVTVALASPARAARSHTKTGATLRKKSGESAQQSWTLQTPFRLAELVGVLNTIADTNAIISPKTVLAQKDGGVHTTGLSRLIDEIVNVSQLGGTSLPSIIVNGTERIDFVRLQRGIFWGTASDLNLDELQALVASIHPINFHRIPYPGTKSVSMQGHLNELIWTLSCVDPQVPVIPPSERHATYHLRSWPPLSVQSSSEMHLRVITALVKGPYTIHQLTSLSGATSEAVVTMLHAARRCDLLEVVLSLDAKAEATDQTDSTQESASKLRKPYKRPWVLELLRNALRVA